MRIDFLGAQAPVELGPEKTPTVKPLSGSVGETGNVPQDTASLSKDQNSVPVLTQQALATAQGREAKVEALRQSVADGSYSVDPASVADAMVSGSD